MDLTLAPRMVRQVRLRGAGHLAAASRIELRRVGLLREVDYGLPELLPPLVIVCADVEGDHGIAHEALRATADRCPVLMACLAVPLIRIGPLVEPATASSPRERPTTGAGRDASVDGRYASAAPAPHRFNAGHSGHARAGASASVSEPDLKTTLCVRVGALLVAAQALSFLQGARNQCVLNTLVEVNPLSIESRAYQVLKQRH
jgi:hypothetical protein